MNLPRLDLDPLQRRAAINAAIATGLTLVLGFGVLALAGGGDGEPVARPEPRTTSASPPPPTCLPTWDTVATADPGDASRTLSDVAVLSAGEAWAVGSLGDPLEPDGVLIERWDGNAWTAEEGPNPGTETNGLSAVDASEPNDVWAVGRTSSFTGDRPLVVRYDGTAWTEVAGLPPDATGVLTGVEAVSPDDVWVVGTTGDAAAGTSRAFVLHWDGELWATVDLGRAAGNGASSLSDVAALDGGGDLWAVGGLRDRPLVLRFDGRRWERLETEVRGETTAVEPVGRDDAFAVGFPIQRYRDGAWTVSGNVRNDGLLQSVAAVSPNDVWAVGLQPRGALTKTLIVRFDGEKWRRVEGPTVGGADALTGIDALDDGTVLAVGYRDVEEGRRTFAIRGTTCLGEA